MRSPPSGGVLALPSPSRSWWGMTMAVVLGGGVAHAMAHGLSSEPCGVLPILGLAWLPGGVAATLLLRRLLPLYRWARRGGRVPPSPAALRDLDTSPSVLGLFGACIPMGLGFAEGWLVSREHHDVLATYLLAAWAVTPVAAALGRVVALPVLRPWFHLVGEMRARGGEARSWRWAAWQAAALAASATTGVVAWWWHAGLRGGVGVALLAMGVAAGFGGWGFVGCWRGSVAPSEPPALPRSQEATSSRDVGVRSEAWRRARLQAVAFLAHDLRAPLNALLGFSGMLEGDGGNGLSEEQRQDVRLMERAARGMLGRVDVVLECARLEMGGAEQACWVPVVEWVNDVAHRARRLLGEHVLVRFDIEMSAGIPPIWLEARAASRAVALVVAMLAERLPEETEETPRTLRLRIERQKQGIGVQIALVPPCCQGDVAHVAGSRLLQTVFGALGATITARDTELRIGPLGAVGNQAPARE